MRTHILILSMIICGIFLFSSCDKEQPISGKVIGFRSDNYRENFIYDGEKIVAIETHLLQNEEWKHVQTYTYKYENNKVIKQDVSISSQMTFTYTISLDNGRIEKIHHDDYDISYFYTYEEGYLSKVIAMYADNPSRWYETLLTYENGNITRIQEYDMPRTGDPEGIRYEYDTPLALNNTNIDLFRFFMYYDQYYLTDYINSNVQRSKHLPSKVNGQPVSYEIKDGYVTKISRIVDGRMHIMEIIYE